jgi:hypothetical protein
MNSKAYIISFDKGGVLDHFDYQKFHNRLTTDKEIINWWHHLESCYIIIVPSHINSTSISNFIMEIAPQKKHFVCELNLNDHNGWLPKEAWEWINSYKN